MNTLRTFAATVVAGASMLVVAPSQANATAANAPAYTGAPALQTTVDTIAAGSGPAGFDAVRLVRTLAGSKASAEIDALGKKFGSDDVRGFFDVFTFVVNDSVKIINAAQVPLPKPSKPAPDGKTLAASLYKVGVTPAGSFDADYMLDALVTHPVRVAVMKDIDAKFGDKADAKYRAVLAQAMADLDAGNLR